MKKTVKKFGQAIHIYLGKKDGFVVGDEVEITKIEKKVEEGASNATEQPA